MSRYYTTLFSLLFLPIFTGKAISTKIISDKKIDQVIKQLTIEQKARLLVGSTGCNDYLSHKVPGVAGWTYNINSFGIPSINLADGPVGIRFNPVESNNQEIRYNSYGLPIVDSSITFQSKTSLSEGSYATCFPSTTALAATWDKELALQQGMAMGSEAQFYGIDIILSPGINIMRNPLCGRNFEYYSEDPLLTGILASEIIKGIQKIGVGTCLKHFVANNQQTAKKYNDARMTTRALREIYLSAFERCVRSAKPWSVMGSYNKIAGEYTQTNQELLVKLLRDEWGFKGLVMTDWTVRRPTADLLNARCALIMPGEDEIVNEIIQAVNNGKVSQSTINACVKDVLHVVANSLSSKGRRNTDISKNTSLSRIIGANSMVLLENRNSTLPLSIDKTHKIALFGVTAYKSIAGGTGSSNVNKRYIIDISFGLESSGFILSKRLSSLYKHYCLYMSNLLDKNPNCPDWQKISYHREVLPEANIACNKDLITAEAQTNDMAVIVIGRGAGETSDRQIPNDFNLSVEESKMIDAVCEAFHKENKRVIVIMNVCGVIELYSWCNKPDAILMAWFPGQECGNAITDVLTGKVTPCGRLPMTIPIKYEDIPSSNNYPYIGQTEGKNFDYTLYEEDIYVGYRYFNTANHMVAYPFGYGLSYTEFEYSNAQICRLGNKFIVKVNVCNIGKCQGREVVQLYVKAPSSSIMPKPESELKAFNKTRSLKPGENQTIELVFSLKDLASFDSKGSRWISEKGNYVAELRSSANSKAISSMLFKINKDTTWNVSRLLEPITPINTIHPETFNK